MNDRYIHNFLGLPTFALNALSGGMFFFSICLGIKMIKTPELSLKVANAQLVTSSSADRLTELAEELDTQAELIKQKDIAYQQLTKVYQQSLQGQKGYGRLQDAIETVGELPEVTELDSIQTEISTTKEILGGITPE
jgi:transcription initiation factor TFIID subunit TAF12